MAIEFTREQRDAMRRHAEEAYPHECCGFLFGVDSVSVKRVTIVQNAANTRDDSPQNRYLIDPREFLKAERYARETRQVILGIYHSHPDHPAYPSEFDREHAWPYYSYIILSVEKGKVVDAHSWVLDESRSAFSEEAAPGWPETRPDLQPATFHKRMETNDMPKVLIPTALKSYTGGETELEVGGGSVGAAMEEVMQRYPELRKHLYDDSGRIRSFVNIYVNDEDTRSLQRLETPVKESDEVTVVPSIAGGSPEAFRDPIDRLPELTPDEKLRYSRHLIMPEVGVTGQRKLKAASILCVGAGGLGSPLALYLAAAGIGRLGLLDFDVVDFTNLHRQVIHFTEDVGKPKLQSAAEKIARINPNVHVEPHEVVLTSANALELFQDYDIIIDGTDNFPTRYLVNDACVLLGKPNVYGSIFRFEGMVSVFDARVGPCYRCLYPEPPPPGLVPSCAEGGVLGILPGLIGVAQATEAIKLVLGIGDPLIGRLLMIDALRARYRELKLRKDPECPICGENPTLHELIDYNQFCGIPTHAEEGPGAEWEITPKELKAKLDRGDKVQIIDVRNPEEWEIARISGAHLLPLPQLEQRMNEIPRDQDVVLQCKSGARSGRALETLRAHGYQRVKNLVGGILAWSDEVDPLRLEVLIQQVTGQEFLGGEDGGSHS